MPQVAIIVAMEVAAGRRDQLLPLLMAHEARCLKDEAGVTQQFEVLVRSAEHMHAALDVNLPNYASAIVSTEEIANLVSAF